MEIGDKIRKTREKKGLSRDYLAALLDMEVRTYEKIENNQRDVYLKEARKIAVALEITVQELLFGEPRLVFENCNPHNGSLYHNGTVHYQHLDEIKSVYEDLVSALKQTIQDKDRIIELLSNNQTGSA